MTVDPRPPGRDADAWDRRLAIVVAMTTFGVYLATIYPGLTLIGDASKFAFVGKILGTPHMPGYPLYVMVSHVFSYLPFDNLAYQMNVLSSLLGAATVGVAYLVMRRLGTDRAPATACALALGFGHAFWSRALYAKTYTLHTTLVAIGMLFLLKWSQTRRLRDFYAAVAVFALSLGNHLTVIALIPALVLYPLLTDRRSILRARTIAFILSAVLVGLAQYLFILIRTRQGGPVYMEARARTLTELWSVMTASRFSHEVGAYAPATLWSERVPLVADLVFTELGVFGLVLLVTGLIVLASRRPREALLLGLGGLSVTALTANMSSEEDQGFLLAAFVLFWVTISVGVQALLGAVRRIDTRLTPVLALGLLVVLPAAQVAANYRVNDHHAETFETAYFRALFAGLPSETAIVHDEYPIDMILNYMFYGEQAAGGRDIRFISGNRDEVNEFQSKGFTVIAFRAGRDALEQSGFNFAPFSVTATGRAADVLGRREMYRVLSMPVCVEIGNAGWQDLTPISQPNGRISVRVDNYRPFDARLVFYATADRPTMPLLVEVEGPGVPRLDVEMFREDDGAASARLRERIEADRVTAPDALIAARHVTRAEVRVNDRGEFVVMGLGFGVGTRATIGAAWVDQDEAKRATICSHPLADADVLPPGQARRVIGWDATDVQLVNGWHDIERRPGRQDWRWTTDRATLLVPIGEPRLIRITISADPFVYPMAPAPVVALSVNDQPIGSRDLASSRVSWTVPGARWRAGLNELVFEVPGAARPVDVGLSPDDRLLGMAVTAIELAVEALPPGERPQVP